MLPKYKQAALVLAERIRTGQYPPGSKFRSEPEIMDEFDCSRPTARNATRMLIQQGLIRIDRGRGTFVRHHRLVTRDIARGLIIEYRATHGSGIDDEIGVWRRLTGIEADVQVHTSYRWTTADEDLADAFGVKPGTRLLERNYPYTLDGQPHQVFQSWLLASMVEGTPVADIASEAPGRGSMQALHSIGVDVDWAREVIQSRNADDTQAAMLDIPAGQAIFVVRRTLYDASSTTEPGRPVEFGIATVPGDRLEMLIDIHLPSMAKLREADPS